MITEKLKNNVLFVGVDGCGDYKTDSDNTGIRMKYLSQVRDVLKKNNLKAVICSPLTEYGDIHQIPFFGLTVASGYNFNIFFLKDLYSYLKEYDFTHIIYFQWDGFPINFNKWDDFYLDYDFIGPSNGDIMNGGISVRSRKLLEDVSEWTTLTKLNEFYTKHGHMNEDMIYQSTGLKFNFPSSETCDKFASDVLNDETFGMHLTDKNVDVIANTLKRLANEIPN